MLQSYLPVLVFAGLGIIVGGAFTLLNRVTGPKRPNPIKGQPYECGLPSHITRTFAHWDAIDVKYKGETLRSTGHGFSGNSSLSATEMIAASNRPDVASSDHRLGAAVAVVCAEGVCVPASAADEVASAALGGEAAAKHDREREMSDAGFAAERG